MNTRKNARLVMKVKPIRGKKAAVWKLKAADESSFCTAVRHSIRLTQQKGNPVAKYDMDLRLPYLEYPGGRREYVE